MKAIIMAAGKGTRLQEAGNPMPKVHRRANGRPLLSYVIDMLPEIDNSDITVVTGFMHEMVEKEFADTGVRFIKQGDDGYGTGYAVMCGLKDPQFDGYHGNIIVLNGDSPLTKLSTVAGLCLIQKSEKADCTLLVNRTDLKLPYGRIIRGGDGNIIDIREEKECTEEEKKIKELNSGAYVFNADALREGLARIHCNPNAHEYYLTDVPPAIAKMGKKVSAYISTDDDELWGVNTPDDLITVENIIKAQLSQCIDHFSSHNSAWRQTELLAQREANGRSCLGNN